MAPIVFAVYGAWSMATSAGTTTFDAVLFVAWMPIGYIFALIGELLLGAPLLLLLWRLRLVSWWSAIGGGILVAAGSSLLIRLPTLVRISDVFATNNLIIGGLSGLCFWLCWRLADRESK